MKKRIIIAGIYRSGTTALFNIVRLICEQKGPTVSMFLNDSATPDDIPEADYQVLKVHKWHDKRSPAFINSKTIILTSFRAPEEVRNSMIRAREKMPTFTGHPHDLPKYMEWLVYWNAQPQHKYMMEYNKLISSPKNVIEDVGDAIGVSSYVNPIYRKLFELELPTHGIDPVTLLHAGHMTEKPSTWQKE